MSKVTEEADRAARETPPEPPSPGGAVAASDPHAARAAAAVLRDGGNAVDAAVCAAGVLAVTKPATAGIGGSCVAIVWNQRDGRLAGLDGRGRMPARASLEEIGAQGGHLGATDARAVPIPGVPDSWSRLIAAEGTRALGDVLAPAIHHAREQQGAPELADTLRAIARQGTDAFYRGEPARRIVELLEARGGWLRMDDLAQHGAMWVTPLETSYRGHPVVSLPPHGDGRMILTALRILEEHVVDDMAPGERTHVAIETIKRAWAAAMDDRSDPQTALDGVDVEAHADAVGGRAAGEPLREPRDVAGECVTVVDEAGHACTLIQGMGAGIEAQIPVSGAGLCLDNAGASLVLDADSPEALAPGAPVAHGLTPMMGFRSDRPWLALAATGRSPAQALFQLLVDRIDFDMDAQTALEALRWRWVSGAQVTLEPDADAGVARALRERGHEIVDAAGTRDFGIVQLAQIEPSTAVRTAAADPRGEGEAVETVEHVEEERAE